MARGGSNSGKGKNGNAGRSPGHSGGSRPNYQRPTTGGTTPAKGNTGGTSHKPGTSTGGCLVWAVALVGAGPLLWGLAHVSGVL